MYKYTLSAIMPIYNSASYLEEAIESVINQSLGFEKIQLILVDDGSCDQSAEIIKKYSDKYENIVAVAKENGGVASARNKGLEYVEGKYVTFPDPDDTISRSTYKDAVALFEENYDKISVVSFPIYFFGDARGEHPLNSKFKGENRIIDLEAEGEFQLHITSSVIKSALASKIHFNSALATSEDAEVLLKLLIDSPYLGVVSSGRYNYRKRAGSLISTAQAKKEWYLSHIHEYFDSVIDYAREKNRKIPRFVQNALLYDLSWKLGMQDAPPCLSTSESKEYKKALLSTLSCLDTGAILDTPYLTTQVKQYILTALGSEISPEDYPFTLEFLESCGDNLKIIARIDYPAYAKKPDGAIAYINGGELEASCTLEPKRALLGKPMVNTLIAEYTIPKAELCEGATSYFAVCVDKQSYIASELLLGKHFPLEKRYKNAYTIEDDVLFTCDENAIITEQATPKKAKIAERRLLKELWKSNQFAERKAVVARILARLYKRFHKKPLWLISDRLNMAGDNGEALFEYLNNRHIDGISYAFAINKGEDYARLKRTGRVVNRASLKYKVMHLCADIIISSHAEDFVTNPFDYYSQPYKDILAKKKFVFLQHGVTKDDLSSWLDKFNKNIKGITCSAMAEYTSIISTYPYHYTEKEVWLTGLARFDRLVSKPERLVAVLPTWRRSLVNNIDIATGEWSGSSLAEHSDYAELWQALITDKRLAQTLERHDYRLLFVPHPNMSSSLEFKSESERVIVKKRCNYAEMYQKSALLVTDYSSVAFDMAYLKKPVLYAQLDADTFFLGNHTYKKGYFDYEKNGFGKVAYTLDGIVDNMIQCIENNCTLDAKYRERIEKFFAYDDGKCCERIVEKILSIGAQNDNSK